jgi:uncharacterized protein YeaO (DUF488 family)
MGKGFGALARPAWRKEDPMRRAVRPGRVYDAPTSDDGLRILVDRLWPRGLTKAAASLDEWCKDVAPSTPLRRWYGHQPERFAEFRRRYLAELAGPEARAAVDRLRKLLAQGPVTLLTASADIEHSQAAVLAKVLREPEKSSKSSAGGGAAHNDRVSRAS